MSRGPRLALTALHNLSVIRHGFPAAICVLLAACALRSGDVAPLPTDRAQFATWSCDALVDELRRELGK